MVCVDHVPPRVKKIRIEDEGHSEPLWDLSSLGLVRTLGGTKKEGRPKAGSEMVNGVIVSHLE